MAKKRGNQFAGVDDIYLTKKSIAVRHISGVEKPNGNISFSIKTKYYPKTRKNLAKAKDIHGYIRYGR